ncbi:MAG: hypothetical protein V2I33_23860 [Kangiellaceae bacterium]|jgi:hypothetical protein|nr:hypothetical protein [Kangiellaceae bacterium]
MKKHINFPILTLLLLSILIYSCSNDNENLVDQETSLNEVIFEDMFSKTNVSPNFYDNHFYLIEKLGNNQERTEVINTAKKNSVDLSTLNSRDVKKFYFNNSPVIMYSISLKNSANKIIIYKYNDLYQIMKAEYYSIESKMQFNLKTLDDNMFYSLQKDAKDRIGNIHIENNEKINNFNNEVYSIQMAQQNIDLTTRVSEEGCCRQESGWSACMDCTVEACGRSWLCVGALVIAGPEVMAGFAASCIGAGPNTFC